MSFFRVDFSELSKSTAVTGIIRDPRVPTRLFSRCHAGTGARLASGLSFRPPAREASPHLSGVRLVGPRGAIERLASDAELGAKLAHIRAGLAHGCLSESQLRCGHLEWPSAVEPRAKQRRE
jgi:hypothetical protein